MKRPTRIKQKWLLTERGNGFQYLIDVEVMEMYEHWNLMDRLGRVVLYALFYRQGFEKLTGCCIRLLIRLAVSYIVAHVRTSRALQSRASALAITK